MQKLTPLKISFCVSIALHVLILGALGVFKFHPAEIRQRGNDPLALTIVATPTESTPLPTVKIIAPTPLPSTPVKTAPPKEFPTPVALPPRPAIAISQPEPVKVVEKPAAQPAPHADITLLKSDEHSPDVQAQPPIKAQPDYLKNPEPVYPEAAWRRHEQGLVLLTVGITADGRVEHIEVKKSSGFPLLDKAALDAVHDWEFEPARLGPVALASEIEVPVRFEIK
ncbi:MAG TPA: TonB family protein [Verrucomicrobiae bacterium]|jgi:protein TonB